MDAGGERKERGRGRQWRRMNERAEEGRCGVAHHVGKVDAAEAGGCGGWGEWGGGVGGGGGGEWADGREGALFGVQVRELESVLDLPVGIGVQAVCGCDEAGDLEGVLSVAGAQNGGALAEWCCWRAERHHRRGMAAAGEAHALLPREPPEQAFLLQDHSVTLYC